MDRVEVVACRAAESLVSQGLIENALKSSLSPESDVASTVLSCSDNTVGPINMGDGERETTRWAQKQGCRHTSRIIVVGLKNN